MIFLILLLTFPLFPSSPLYLNVSYPNSSGNGAFNNPFNSFYQALHSISNTTTTQIIIDNSQNSSIIEVSQHISINSSLQIEYTFNFYRALPFLRSLLAFLLFDQYFGITVGNSGNLSFFGIVFRRNCSNALSAISVVDGGILGFQVLF